MLWWYNNVWTWQQCILFDSYLMKTHMSHIQEDVRASVITISNCCKSMFYLWWQISEFKNIKDPFIIKTFKNESMSILCGEKGNHNKCLFWFIFVKHFCDMLYSPDEFRNIFDRVGPITLLVNHHIMNITGNSTREW